MATALPQRRTGWTAADLVDRFGPVPLARVVMSPPPGEATVEDAVRLSETEGRPCELIDGVLLEKSMGAWESFLAGRLITLLNLYLANRPIGVALTSDGLLQVLPGQVRIPDVSFLSWESLEGSGFPDEAAPLAAPDLAVEVLSAGNTPREMERKLHEYFEAGVKLVWYVDPRAKTVTVYTAPSVATALGEADTLTGGGVLPGFEASLKELFALPAKPQP